MNKFAVVKVILPGFIAGGKNGKVEIILPDGRDIAPDLYVQAIDIKARVEDFTIITITCCARVEAAGLIFDPERVMMGVALAQAVKHSGWR